MKISTLQIKILICLILQFLLFTSSIVNGQGEEKIKIKFIDYFFENASPLSWKIQGDTIVKISLLADYERDTHNRQTTHWYFKLIADKGSHVKFILSKMLADVYNSKLATNGWKYENDEARICKRLFTN